MSTPIPDMQSLQVNRRRALWFNKEHVLQIRADLAKKKKDAIDAVALVALKKLEKREKYMSTLEFENVEGIPPIAGTKCSNAACSKKSLLAGDVWTQCPLCSAWFCPKASCGYHGDGPQIKGHRKVCGKDD